MSAPRKNPGGGLSRRTRSQNASTAASMPASPPNLSNRESALRFCACVRAFRRVCPARFLLGGLLPGLEDGRRQVRPQSRIACATEAFLPFSICEVLARRQCFRWNPRRKQVTKPLRGCTPLSAARLYRWREPAGDGPEVCTHPPMSRGRLRSSSPAEARSSPPWSRSRHRSRRPTD